MEIGSIYEINPLNTDLPEEGTGNFQGLKEVEKYQRKYCKYTASGREAIAWALSCLEVNRPETVKKCLMPAYMCDTVFFPFLNAGWELCFYHVGKNLQAEEEELRTKVENVRPGLLFIHAYYGVDTWKPMRSLLKEWQKQGICIMEDVTQSYYRKECGSEADYVVGSLRKWYAVPDGGFVVSNHAMPARILSVDEGFVQSRLKLLTEKWEYLYGRGTPEEKSERKAAYLKKNKEMEAFLDEWRGINRLSPVAEVILSRQQEEACRQKRNQNYRHLWNAFSNSKSFCPVFDGEEADCAPLYFPIYAEDREKLQGCLQENDIFAPVLWPVGKENADSLSEEEQYIFSHLLAIPIDQRYGEEEMKVIVKVLREYEQREAKEDTGEDREG